MATVGNGFELVAAKDLFRLLCDIRQMRGITHPMAADVSTWRIGTPSDLFRDVLRFTYVCGARGDLLNITCSASRSDQNKPHRLARVCEHDLAA